MGVREEEVFLKRQKTYSLAKESKNLAHYFVTLLYFVGSTHIVLLYELELQALLSRCSVVAPFASTPHGIALRKVELRAVPV